MQLLDYQQRALSEISKHSKGKVLIPTGGGKTVVMMQDAKNRIAASDVPLTIVVVAPRILLANQLSDEFEQYLKSEEICIAHVHSGETHHFSSTQSHKIAAHNAVAKALQQHHLIFTTYHSLERVNESGIVIDVAYFDEAHNSTKPMNSVGVARTSESSNAAYFFTATPKIAMSNSSVYGSNIISISAKELIGAGTILSPQVETYEFDEVRTKENAAIVDAENILGILSDMNETAPKVLVAAPSTKVIWDALSHTSLLQSLIDMDYVIMHITSKHGAYINRKKVTREKFFEQLTLLGKDSTQKMIVFHYSILSEGINVPGLTHCIMLRNLPTIEMLQTIGRVIRVSQEDRSAIQNKQLQPGQFEFYKKPYGKIIIPVSNGYGDQIAKKIQILVNTVFVQGETVTT
jgi:superfamily II DNA or RNA helicase